MIGVYILAAVVLLLACPLAGATRTQQYIPPPVAVLGKKGAYVYAIPGPDVNQPVPTNGGVYSSSGTLKCSNDAIRCTAILIGAGGYSAGTSCGGGGAYITGIELAPSLSYSYTLYAPSTTAQDPTTQDLYSTISDPSGLYVVKAGSGYNYYFLSGTYTGPAGGGRASSTYPPGTAPGVYYGGNSETPATSGVRCQGGFSVGVGVARATPSPIYDAASSSAYLNTAYPWGAGASSGAGAQGGILVTEYYSY
jgi:hypothetical protein